MAKERRFEVPKKAVSKFGDLAIGQGFILIQGDKKPYIGDGEPVMVKTDNCVARADCSDACAVFIGPETPVADLNFLKNHIKKSKKKEFLK